MQIALNEQYKNSFHVKWDIALKSKAATQETKASDVQNPGYFENPKSWEYICLVKTKRPFGV